MTSSDDEPGREHFEVTGALVLKFMSFLAVTGYTWWSLAPHLSGPWWQVALWSVAAGVLVSAIMGRLMSKWLPSWLHAVFRVKRDKIPVRVQDHIIEQATDHFPALSRNVAKSLKINDYGAVISDVRPQAILEFLDSFGVRPEPEMQSVYVSFVLKVISELEIEFAKIGFSPDTAPVKGHDFEHWVARELERFGWKARATAGAGDQGIDVIAEKHGIKVGIQCKRYSSAVGNKSVQEAISGKQFHGLDVAAVLTTSSFTRAAKQLATSTDIVLMTHYDIPQSDQHLLTRQRTGYGN